MRWSNYYRSGSTETTAADNRRADMRRQVIARWRAGYLADTAELRKADGRVIPLDQEGKTQ